MCRRPELLHCGGYDEEKKAFPVKRSRIVRLVSRLMTAITIVRTYTGMITRTLGTLDQPSTRLATHRRTEKTVNRKRWPAATRV